MRSPIIAASALWVIISTVCFSSRLELRNISSTASEFLVSRLPVGSSARMMAGRVMNARAIATRCCSPPDSSDGRWSRRPLMPSRLVRCDPDKPDQGVHGRPAGFRDPISMFPACGQRGQQVEFSEKQNQSRDLRIRVRSASFSATKSTPSMISLPEVARASPPRM